MLSVQTDGHLSTTWEHGKPIDAIHHQLREVLMTKFFFPTEEAAGKLLYLVTDDILRK
ncbi:MAG: hypothetical protein IT320_17775 [Anaerolineae bacterium]|jgi:hypothetical protein|nr:hypothetical protein [Anaerolineae bacterium]